jgi:hypothetical protein
MEKQTIELFIGEDVTEPVDHARIAHGLVVPPKSEGEIGGRALVGIYIQHPMCRAINYIVEDPAKINHYWCWNCGRIFTAGKSSLTR